MRVFTLIPADEPEDDENAMETIEGPSIDEELELAYGGPHPLIDKWKPARVRAKGRGWCDYYIWGIGDVVSARVKDVLSTWVTPAEGVRFLPVQAERKHEKRDYYCLYFDRFFDVLAKEKCKYVAEGQVLQQPVFAAAKLEGRHVFGIEGEVNAHVYVNEQVAEALRLLRPVDMDLVEQPVWPRAAKRSAPRRGLLR